MSETSKSSADTGELTRELTVQNKMGIHARPAAMIVRVSNKYPDVDLFVEKGDEQVNGKSIMGLMMLAAGQGSNLRFVASGTGAKALLDEMEGLFSRKFEEA
ncbi:MAG: HPr family phosphocarrier protein [Opitutales bacterium]